MQTHGISFLIYGEEREPNEDSNANRGGEAWL